ncbi:MAG: class I adenylate-forming enzyme family protein [Gammaproteobacteria bacterium]|nr:class I adenylate-forming enzyme family protein [Gammaproteobacteria bacterium]
MPQLKSAYDEAMAQLSGPGAPFETTRETIAGIEYTVCTQAQPDLRALYTAAAEFGDKEFLIYEGERWTFARMLQQAASFGHQLLHKSGVQKGDRVAIAMRNYPEWMTAFIGITSIGAVAVPLNSWGQAKELAFAINDAGARVVFCDQQRLDLIADKLEELDLQVVLARPEREQQPANTETVDQYVAGAESAAMPEVDIDTQDLAMMLYTSGTTGAPKGAVSTHHAICQAIANFECSAMASAMINPEAIGHMLESGFEPTQMLAVPLFHVSGCHAVFLSAFKAGRKVVMMHKWDVDKALQLIAAERITILSAAPSMLMQLLESPHYDQADTSSLFGLGGGGSATPPRASRLMQEKVPKGYPGTGWGLTETNAIGTSFTGKPFQNKPGSAGYVQLTVEISVRDEAGKEVPPGATGELWIKSPSLVKEYWNRPDANAKDFSEGWFNSGDIGYFDEDGYLFLSDRAKDMVIRGGENIYPAEIEGVLFDHPQVEDVAAFGIPDEKLGEQLAVAVVPKAGATISEDDIRSYAGEHLDRFKVTHYVCIRDE